MIKKTNHAKISPIDRAAQEASEGRLWRAKEILSGYIASSGYAQESYAAYGRVLAQMHDAKEAGKFLFLSGLAEKEEEEYLELFLSTVRGKPYQCIYSQFPSAIRTKSLSEYPERVRETLITLGFPEEFNRDRSFTLQTGKNKWSSVLATLFVFVFLLVLIVGLLNGFSVISNWFSK